MCRDDKGTAQNVMGGRGDASSGNVDPQVPERRHIKGLKESAIEGRRDGSPLDATPQCSAAHGIAQVRNEQR
jgi:hypothetical protein